MQFLWGFKHTHTHTLLTQGSPHRRLGNQSYSTFQHQCSCNAVPRPPWLFLHCRMQFMSFCHLCISTGKLDCVWPLSTKFGFLEPKLGSFNICVFSLFFFLGAGGWELWFLVKETLKNVERWGSTKVSFHPTHPPLPGFYLGRRNKEEYWREADKQMSNKHIHKFWAFVLN